MSNTLIPTLELLGKIKERLVSYEFSAGVKVFDKVEFYSAPNLIRALEDLRIHKGRVCLIVPDRDVFEYERAGRDVRIEVWREVILLMADRDWGKRQAAQTGDAETHGVIKMKDLVVDRLLGDNLEYKPRLLSTHPVEGGPFLLVDKDREAQAGRESWQLTWQASAGHKIMKEF